MEDKLETFSIKINLLEGRPAVEITVIPSIGVVPNDQAPTFVTVLDGVTLATIRYDPDHLWYKVEGSLDQADIEKMGSAIDNYYM
jgi:hypothetical protein